MIFISGIHAVGKGYFCGLVKKELGIEAYSASDLIAKARNAGFSSDKLVADIEENQQYLLAKRRGNIGHQRNGQVDCAQGYPACPRPHRCSLLHAQRPLEATYAGKDAQGDELAGCFLAGRFVLSARIQAPLVQVGR